MTHADERAHAEAMRAHPRLSRAWTRARDALVVSALPVAEAEARRWAGGGGDFDELHSAALEGLLVAAEKYDPARGRFAAAARVYAAKAARQCRRDSPTVRPSDRAVTERARAARVEARHCARTGRLPTDEEVAAAAGLTVARLRDVRALPVGVSLDAPRTDTGLTLGDGLQGPPDEDPARVEVRARLVRDLLACLSPRQRQAVRVTQGLGVWQVADDREYADGLSERHPTRARALARQAVEALRAVVQAMPMHERAHMVEACWL